MILRLKNLKGLSCIVIEKHFYSKEQNTYLIVLIFFPLHVEPEIALDLFAPFFVSKIV